MTTELHPLRLAVGSHQPGSGKGCAMNVVAWMMDPTNITDYPECAEPMLAAIVQSFNDSICRGHAAERKMLCPDCTAVVLPLAFDTIGTAGAGREVCVAFGSWLIQRTNDTQGMPRDNGGVWFVGGMHAAIQDARDQLNRTPLQMASFWSLRNLAKITATIASLCGDYTFTADAIAEWHRLAGTTPTQPPQAAVDHAARQMAVVR